MWYAKACVTIASILATASISLATTIHVPADQPTIQAGIDAAVDGDTVLVADGTYTGEGNRDIDFLGKAIVVMSENGAENCVIDCEGYEYDPHRGFIIRHGINENSVVHGFTITNGYVYAGNGGAILCNESSPIISDNIITGNTCVRIYTEGGSGGGIYCSNASPTIENNTISENTASYAGGGIACWYNSSPIIADNTITGNVADAGYGGGIYCRQNSSPTITRNTITENAADDEGGGICCFSASPTITSNTITGNTADYAGGIYCTSSSPSIEANKIAWNVGRLGGGIYCVNSSPTIAGNTIAENTANDSGGGIRCHADSSPIITDNTISGNMADDEGGGIACYYSPPTITGNTITQNTTITGGGIYCFFASPTVRDNTISGNAAANYGGGIYCVNSSPTIAGNTIAENTAAIHGGGIAGWYVSSPTITNTILWGDSPDEIYVESTDPVVTYSDVENGWQGEGNIDEEPIFVLADKNDYRLLWGSPCIDTGDPSLFDPDGTRSDMGAHYFNQDDYLTLYMTPDTTEVAPGGQMGVTYTIINRWPQKEPFTLMTRAVLPDGRKMRILGPEEYHICARHTAQIHLTHDIPSCAYIGMYEYQGAIGILPTTPYDWDRFRFRLAGLRNPRERHPE